MVARQDTIVLQEDRTVPEVFLQEEAGGRKMVRALICLLLFLIVSGCGGPDTRNAVPSEEAPFKVALITPGSINDAGWNALGYAGLKQIEEKLGATISHKHADGPKDFEADFREYARQGYQMIIGHGFEMQEFAVKVSQDYPDTVFVITAGNRVEGNVVPIIPKLEEATYLLGVIAARMSKTGTAGLVGGQEIPPIKSTFEAFKAGALSVNPNFRIRTAFVGDWEDTAAAKEATISLINQGADFIFHNADAAGRGAIQACQEHEGVWAFGSNSDQNNLAPDTVLASAVLEIPQTFVEIAQSIKDGTFKPQEFRLTVANDHTSLVYNPRLKDRIPLEVQKEVIALKEKLKDGSLVVERAHF